MSELANQIMGLAGRLGTLSGLKCVDEEIRILNERLLDPHIELSRDEIVELQAGLAFLGSAISEMTRVTRGMLEQAGVKGLEHVG